MPLSHEDFQSSGVKHNLIVHKGPKSNQDKMHNGGNIMQN